MGPDLSTWWTTEARRVGILSAMTVAGIGILYVTVIVSWLLVEASPGEPIGDPYLAVMEVLTILSAFAVVGFAVALFCFVNTRSRIPAAAALISAILAAGLTATVHFVQLTAVRQLWRSGDLAEYRLVWPSLLFGVEYFAWDILVGLFMVFTSWALSRMDTRPTGYRTFLVGGILCLLGAMGPLSGQMLLQNLSVLGYAIFLPIAGFQASRMFERSVGSQHFI